MSKSPKTPEEFYYAFAEQAPSELSIEKAIEFIESKIKPDTPNFSLITNIGGHMAAFLQYNQVYNEAAWKYAERLINTWKSNKQLTQTDISNLIREAIIVYTVIAFKVFARKNLQELERMYKEHLASHGNGGDKGGNNLIN